MSEVTDLVVIEPVNAMTVFKSADQIEDILQKVEREVMSFVPDVTTAKGRKEIASLAYKVAQTKTYLDGLGKDLVAELKEVPKLIDANRKTVRDRLDALRDKARQPYTEWEAEQERIKAEEEARAAAELYSKMRDEADAMNSAFDAAKAEALKIRIASDHELALLMNDKFDRDAAEAKAEAERQRIAHEEELKRQAEEKVKRELAEAAQREIDAAAAREREATLAKERAEHEAKEAAEKAERDRIEAEQRVEREKKEAAERADREKQEAIAAEQRKAHEEADRIRREAEAKEKARLAEEQRIADETAARAANEKHRKAIGTAVVKALTETTSLSREQAIEVLSALKDNKIPHTSITY